MARGLNAVLQAVDDMLESLKYTQACLVAERSGVGKDEARASVDRAWEIFAKEAVTRETNDHLIDWAIEDAIGGR